jgi:hypothetical protein
MPHMKVAIGRKRALLVPSAARYFSADRNQTGSCAAQLGKRGCVARDADGLTAALRAARLAGRAPVTRRQTELPFTAARNNESYCPRPCARGRCAGSRRRSWACSPPSAMAVAHPLAAGVPVAAGCRLAGRAGCRHSAAGPQFPNVSGPTARDQGVQQFLWRALGSGAETLEKRLGEHADVLPPRAQRRKRDLNHGQAVVQILTGCRR